MKMPFATSSDPVEGGTAAAPVDVKKYRDSKDGKELLGWAQSEFNRCKGARLKKQRQWYLNLAYTFGQQWLQVATGVSDSNIRGRIQTQQAPRWQRRKTVNRIRVFVRTETSKFLSTLPNIVAVPATAEDQDVRAAYAAEQTWTSYAMTKKFRKQYSAAVWWSVLTGNGFIKTWWDTSKKVEMPDGGVDEGDIAFRKITPFNIYVPESRESDIEDQPYVIEAHVRPLSWVKQFYAEELKGQKLSATTSGTNTIMDEGYLGLQNAKTTMDSVVVHEFWVKPGATNLLPNGGYFVMVEDIIVSFQEGFPYDHDEYPYTKLEHLFNDTFWADSPIVDLIPLQKEYNEIRTDIGIAARRMGNPQLLAAKNSIVASKMTNEPGAIIEYRPGLPPPGPAPLANLPQYVVDQQDRILMDFDDVSGQHEVSKGQAPAGVTAGTALTYLGERDDNFLTPQYQGIEDGVERIARQTLLLFQQYVDMPRKIKVIGLDSAFDTLLLQGSDIKGGTDVRVEPGSAVGQSQAAKQAQVMDLVSLQIIGPDQALKMLELGGPQKVLDIMNAAERKAQRENMKMKALKDDLGTIQAHNDEFMAQAAQMLTPEDMIDEMGQPIDPATIVQAVKDSLPPVVNVDDFDIHEVHIETHNRFRMSQEYETLPEEVKEQFEKHVAWHQQMGGQQMSQMLMAQAPPDMMGGGEEAAPEDMQGIQPASGSMAPTPDPGPAPAGPTQ